MLRKLAIASMAMRSARSAMPTVSIFNSNNGVVIGITRMDESPRPGLYTFQKRLQELNLKVPVFEVNARQRQD